MLSGGERRTTSRGGLVDKVLELLEGGVEVVVDDDDVVDARGVGVLELDAGLLEALGDGVLGLGAAAAQALLEGGEARGLDEDEARVYAALPDLLDALLLLICER